MPIGGGFVGIERVLRLPEMLFHQLPRVFEPRARLLDAGHERVRMREQHEGQAVAMLRAVLHGGAAVVPVDLPCVAAARLRMRALHESQAVARSVEVLRIPEAPIRHRMVEDEARAADQVARAPVVHRAVVLEEVEEAT